MDSKPNERQLAKDLYLHTDKSQSEIADILNINRKTLYLWIKNGKWEEMKIAARQAPGVILQDIYNHIDEINKKVRCREEDRCPTMEEVEKLRKLLRMTSLINKKNTGTYMEVFQEITLFIARQDIELAHKVTGMADKYIKATLFNKNFNLDNNVADIAAVVTQDEKSDSELPRQIAPDTKWGHDGASPGSAGIAPKPVNINEVTEDIHNAPHPTLLTEEIEGYETSDISLLTPDSHVLPLTPTPSDPPILTEKAEPLDYWGQYLEQRFQISKDPYVTRKNRITVIKYGSTLYGLRNGLFFS